jgi:hypothetical protein
VGIESIGTLCAVVVPITPVSPGSGEALVLMVDAA